MSALTPYGWIVSIAIITALPFIHFLDKDYMVSKCATKSGDKYPSYCRWYAPDHERAVQSREDRYERMEGVVKVAPLATLDAQETVPLTGRAVECRLGEDSVFYKFYEDNTYARSTTLGRSYLTVLGKFKLDGSRLWLTPTGLLTPRHDGRLVPTLNTPPSMETVVTTVDDLIWDGLTVKFQRISEITRGGVVSPVEPTPEGKLTVCDFLHHEQEEAGETPPFELYKSRVPPYIFGR